MIPAAVETVAYFTVAEALTNAAKHGGATQVTVRLDRHADNAAIAARVVITQNAVHKHIGNIFAKLGLSPADGGHRRVLAVLTYLDRA